MMMAIVELCGMRTILEDDPSLGAAFICKHGHEWFGRMDDVECPICGTPDITQLSTDQPATNPRRSPV
jgi:hypothetical protein